MTRPDIVNIKGNMIDKELMKALIVEYETSPETQIRDAKERCHIYATYYEAPQDTYSRICRAIDKHSILTVNTSAPMWLEKQISMLMIAYAMQYRYCRIVYVSHKTVDEKHGMWRMLNGLIPKRHILYKDDDDKAISLDSKSVIFLRDTKHIDDIVGADIDFLVIDECENIHKSTVAALRKCLTGKCAGSGLFIGCNPERKWFKRLFELGMKDGRAYKSIFIDRGR